MFEILVQLIDDFIPMRGCKRLSCTTQGKFFGKHYLLLNVLWHLIWQTAFFISTTPEKDLHFVSSKVRCLCFFHAFSSANKVKINSQLWFWKFTKTFPTFLWFNSKNAMRIFLVFTFLACIAVMSSIAMGRCRCSVHCYQQYQKLATQECLRRVGSYLSSVDYHH